MYLKEIIKNKRNHGMTIIELMVAMAMTAIVVSIIAVVWVNFTRHVVGQRRKSILHAELRQVLEGISTQVRRSTAVLAWHSTGITYVSPNNGDTIVYEYYADELFKNDLPVTFISQDAFVNNFSIDGSDPAEDGSDIILLTISITLADDFGNQAGVRSQVAAKVIDEYAEEEDEELSGWNF